MLQKLADKVQKTMKHALVVEEKVPLDEVENFNEVMLPWLPHVAITSVRFVKKLFLSYNH